MAHEHPVRDTDLHFVIDPTTRAIKNNSGKITLMQYDHQSEIFTFELPRYIDAHDMSTSNKVRVHYINIGSSSKYEPVSGVYEITDLQIDPENEDIVTCSWLLTNNTTQLDGTLNFIIRFSCVTGEIIDYSWSTAIYSGIIVAKTIDSTDEVMENTADILEQWKASLKGDPFTYEDFTPEQLEGLRGPAGIIISETEPTNENHPVWVRPLGEYIVENLGLTGATVGQTVKIKSVDANGVPTEWEAADTSTCHYGARWNKTQAQMTRLYDAASFPTDITNFAHRGSVNPNYNNPFDKIYPWSGRKLCNIDIDAYRALTPGQSITRAVKAWEGDTDFSYTDVNGVWVYTPEFWGKSWDETVGSTEYRYFDVADKPCGGYVHYQERIEGRWHGRTQTVNIGGTDKTCLIPSVGMPAKSIAMSTLHTYAKNWGATLDSIFSIDANDLLMIVEFATMNSRSAIGSGVDSMHRQSSDLISAATESTVVKVSKSAGSAFCIPGAIFDIGTTNGGTQVGSFLVVSAVTDPDDSTLLDVTLNAPVTVTTSNYWSVHGMGNAADAEIGSQSGYIGTNGKSIAYYRGEELLGNMFFYILGAYRQTGTQHVFIAHDDNEADATDALNESLHIDTGIALSTTEGYVKKLGILSRSGLLCCPPLCTEKGGDSANPVGDYHYIDASAGNTVLIRGGHAGFGAGAGAFFGYWSSGASSLGWGYAARPRLKNP